MHAVVLDPTEADEVGELLDSLADQSRRPDGITLLTSEPDGPAVALARGHRLVRSGCILAVRPVGNAGIANALSALDAENLNVEDGNGDAENTAAPPAGRGWLWLLTPDSRPEPDALTHLIEATRRSSGVGIVGPKILDRENPRHLLMMGYRLSRSGRPAERIPGLVDQGQFDSRADVLGVPLPGMFLRAGHIAALGGLDAGFGEEVLGLDLSWRSHLAGHRVVLAPAAAVRMRVDTVADPHRWATRRRTRQVALARGGLFVWPLRSLLLLMTSVVAAVVLLLAKRPRAAGAESADLVAALSPARGWAARWRFRTRRRVARRHLRGLFDSPLTAWRGSAEETAVAEPRLRAQTQGAEPGPVSDEAQALASSGPSRWWSWPLVAAVITASALTWVRWRDLAPALRPSGAGVAGGELQYTGADAAGVWASWWDGWSGSGLGAATEPSPWLAPMSALTFLVERLPWVSAGADSAALTTTWLLVAAAPLAVVSAYMAAVTVISHRGARAVLGLIWAAMPPLPAAVDTGRIGPVLVHVAMPLVVAGMVVAGGRGADLRRASATFATVLVLGFIGLFVPGILVIATVTGLGILALGRGWARVRGVVLATLPWAFLGPWLLAALDDPRLLWGGAGATGVSGGTEPWQVLLLHPPVAPSIALWWTAPLVALALISCLRAGPAGRRSAALWGVGLVGAAAALGAPLLSPGVVPQGYPEAGLTVTTWSGSYLSVFAAAVLLAAGAALAPSGRPRAAAWRRAVQAGAVSVAAAAGLALVAWSAVAGVGPALAGAQRPYPAVVTDQADAGPATRVLDLRPSGSSVVYTLQGSETGDWVTDRVRDLSPVTALPDASSDDPEPTSVRLQQTVEAIVGSQAGIGEPATDLAEIQSRLHDLAVAHVVSHGDVEDALTERIDAIPGLTRLGGAGEVQVWRVAGLGEDGRSPVSRVRVVDEEGDLVQWVPVTGAHSAVDTAQVGTVPGEGMTGAAMTGGETTQEATSGGLRLVVSEGSGWSERARVSLDGVDLAVADLDPWPSYPIEPGSLHIEVAPRAGAWHLVTAALALVVAFLALPLGGRREGMT